MSRRLEFIVGGHPDYELRRRLEEAYHSENLIQLILHVHLLIERVITRQLADKLARPEILEDGKYTRWSFHQKLTLYVGLVNPPKDQEQQLFAFNKLRNKIAHGLEDEAACVWDCLPWKGEREARPDARTNMVMTLRALCGSGLAKANPRFVPEVSLHSGSHYV